MSRHTSSNSSHSNGGSKTANSSNDTVDIDLTQEQEDITALVQADLLPKKFAEMSGNLRNITPGEALQDTFIGAGNWLKSWVGATQTVTYGEEIAEGNAKQVIDHILANPRPMDFVATFAEAYHTLKLDNLNEQTKESFQTLWGQVEAEFESNPLPLIITLFGALEQLNGKSWFKHRNAAQVLLSRSPQKFINIVLGLASEWDTLSDDGKSVFMLFMTFLYRTDDKERLTVLSHYIIKYAYNVKQQANSTETAEEAATGGAAKPAFLALTDTDDNKQSAASPTHDALSIMSAGHTSKPVYEGHSSDLVTREDENMAFLSALMQMASPHIKGWAREQIIKQFGDDPETAKHLLLSTRFFDKADWVSVTLPLTRLAGEAAYEAGSFLYSKLTASAEESPDSEEDAPKETRAERIAKALIETYQNCADIVDKTEDLRLEGATPNRAPQALVASSNNQALSKTEGQAADLGLDYERSRKAVKLIATQLSVHFSTDLVAQQRFSSLLSHLYAVVGPDRMLNLAATSQDIGSGAMKAAELSGKALLAYFLPPNANALAKKTGDAAGGALKAYLGETTEKPSKTDFQKMVDLIKLPFNIQSLLQTARDIQSDLGDAGFTEQSQELLVLCGKTTAGYDIQTLEAAQTALANPFVKRFAPALVCKVMREIKPLIEKQLKAVATKAAKLGASKANDILSPMALNYIISASIAPLLAVALGPASLMAGPIAMLCVGAAQHTPQYQELLAETKTGFARFANKSLQLANTAANTSAGKAIAKVTAKAVSASTSLATRVAGKVAQIVAPKKVEAFAALTDWSDDAIVARVTSSLEFACDTLEEQIILSRTANNDMSEHYRCRDEILAGIENSGAVLALAQRNLTIEPNDIAQIADKTQEELSRKAKEEAIRAMTSMAQATLAKKELTERKEATLKIQRVIKKRGLQKDKAATLPQKLMRKVIAKKVVAAMKATHMKKYTPPKVNARFNTLDAAFPQNQSAWSRVRTGAILGRGPTLTKVAEENKSYRIDATAMYKQEQAIATKLQATVRGSAVRRPLQKAAKAAAAAQAAAAKATAAATAQAEAQAAAAAKPTDAAAKEAAAAQATAAATAQAEAQAAAADKPADAAAAKPTDAAEKTQEKVVPQTKVEAQEAEETYPKARTDEALESPANDPAAVKETLDVIAEDEENSSDEQEKPYIADFGNDDEVKDSAKEPAKILTDVTNRTAAGGGENTEVEADPTFVAEFVDVPLNDNSADGQDDADEDKKRSADEEANAGLAAAGKSIIVDTTKNVDDPGKQKSTTVKQAPVTSPPWIRGIRKAGITGTAFASPALLVGLFMFGNTLAAAQSTSMLASTAIAAHPIGFAITVIALCVLAGSLVAWNAPGLHKKSMLRMPRKDKALGTDETNNNSL